MKTTKKLLAVAMIPALMPFHALAQTKLDNDVNGGAAVVDTAAPAESKNGLVEKASGLGNKLWEQAKKALRNANIKKQVNLPTLELAKGLNVGAYYKIESNPSLGGKYSGIDIWELNLSAYPQLFGIDDTKGVGIGASIARQVTYIQQFDTQKESLLRVPYDPITKLPLKSDVFFDKKKNIFTGEEEQVLKAGDFIGYRAPMTFSLGKGFSYLTSGAAASLGLSVGLSYVITGEFDIHVFVMKNNLVRVKILASKAKSKNGSVGISLLGFNGIGQMIVDKLIDTKILEFYFGKSNTDLFVADYIFNMNKPEARELYDSVVGSKLHIFSKDVLKKQIMIANPFASDETIRKRLVADLGDLNAASVADMNKPYMDRTVLKLLNAHNEIETVSNGHKLSLLKILKVQGSESKTGSKISIYANDNDSVKAKFKLDSYSANNSFSFIIWGDKHSTTNSLLTQTDLGDTPIDFIGLQNSRVREDKIMRKSEYNDLLLRLERMLPAEIYSKLNKPNWNFEKSVENAYVQQDITFNTELFKLKSNIEEATIRAALIEILQNYGTLKSKPLGAKDVGGDERDPVTEAFQRRDYVTAYKDWELVMIPQKLAVALNSAYSFKDRYAEFSYLYEKIPLFAEISTALLLKTVPAKDLERIVIARLVMSAKKQTTVISDYPNTETFVTNNLFKEILAQNAYISDQSYNLRNYLKEDGTQYSIDEIMIEKEKQNK